MITVKNLQKNYGPLRALDNVDFEVQQGEILALLGPNGAGKTTAMKIITGFLKSDAGSVEIDGELLEEKSLLRLQNKIGYLPENAPLYPELNVWEHLDFMASVHGIAKEDREKAIREAAKTCGLMEKLYADVSELSKGYKQRLGLAQALIHDPEILILDEPTTGLDPNQIIEIRKFITSLGKKKTIILSTHIMQEVEAIADRVVVINKGRLVGEGTPESLGGQDSVHCTRITIKGCPKKTERHLKKIKNVDRIEHRPSKEKGVIEVSVFTTEDMRSDIVKALALAELELLEIISEKQTMEDIFQKLTQK
ncbi:ATP-binding cassette domain-containing protein [Candidatus Gracilibacteria bacterium]|nr:ATP-binding cassette domain-containing protein [Candidatus Gracilibacteria bacterium]